MRLIILGASGLIGRQLDLEACGQGLDVIGTYCHRPVEGMIHFDLTKSPIRDVASDLGKEDVVFMLSSNINQNWVKDNPRDSRKLNVEANIKAIKEAATAGSKIIYISSEAIFDGALGCYSEDSAPNPLTLYAQQKLEIENYIQESALNFCIIRTGWTVGWGDIGADPIFGIYKALLNEGAKMAEDNIFTMTDVCDTCQAILKLVDQKCQGIYHVAANPPVTRTQLADWIIEFSQNGANMSYETVQFADLTFAEPRPTKSWISNQKLIEEFDQTFMSSQEVVKARVTQIDSKIEEPERTST